MVPHCCALQKVIVYARFSNINIHSNENILLTGQHDTNRYYNEQLTVLVPEGGRYAKLLCHSSDFDKSEEWMILGMTITNKAEIKTKMCQHFEARLALAQNG